MKHRLTISLFHALNSLRNLVGVGAGVATGTDAVVAEALANGLHLRLANPSFANGSATLQAEGLSPWLFRSPMADLGVGSGNGTSLMDWARVTRMLMAIQACVASFAKHPVNQDVPSEQFGEQFVGSDRLGFAYPVTDERIPHPIPRSGRYGFQLAIPT